MVDHAAPSGTTAQSNPAACSKHAGTFAIVVPWQPTVEGGVNQVVINLYREIARTGPYQPLFFVTDWQRPRSQETEAVGCRTVLMRMRPPYIKGYPVLSPLKYLLTLPGSLFRLWRLIARYDIKVINGHFPSLALLSVVLLSCFRIYRGKLLISFHGQDIRSVIAARGLERTLWRWLLRLGDATIFCSDGIAESLHSFDPGLRSITVRNGISICDLLKEKRSVGSHLPPGPFILNIGAFEHKKGQDVLIRAFARLIPDFPDLHLLLLGQRGPVYNDLRSLVARLDLEQRVHFAVNVPHAEVLNCLEEATVFALPSRSEGLPIALLEAGGFGVPTVASRVDGIPEVINSDDVGLLVDADDELGLELALRKLLIDPDLRRSLGKRLQERVIDEFTWQRAWQKYLALVINNRPTSERALLIETGDA